MNITVLDPKKVKPNPYQPRLTMDAAALAELAQSIKDQGLQSPPQVRAVNAHYELAFGHRRFEAWKIAKGNEPFPAFVVELTDQQMAELAATENSQRADLNPIERAKALQRLINDFGMTQERAGKLFGLNTQGAVSNALRLLKLPAGAQDVVASGALAERHARMLVQVSQFKPKDVDRIAKSAAKVAPEERDDQIETDVLLVMEEHAQNLDEAPWEDDWLNKPVATADASVPELRACRGCPHRFSSRRDYESDYCTHTACYELKVKYFNDYELKRVSAKQQIAIAGPEDQLTLFYNGSGRYDLKDTVAKLIKKADVRAQLRLALPTPEQSTGMSTYTMRDLLGSKALVLLTTNPHLRKQLDSGTVKDTKPLTPEKQKQAEEAAKDERRAERAAALREEHDVVWLLQNVTRLAAEQLEITSHKELLIALIENAPEPRYGNKEALRAWMDDLEEQAAKPSKDQMMQLRTLLAYRLISNAAWTYGDTGEDGQLKEIRDRLSELFNGEQEAYHFSGVDSWGLPIKLPKGWDHPPIHKTTYNCHVCGTFAGATKLTQADYNQRGWKIRSWGIYCPDCADHAEPKPKKQTWFYPGTEDDDVIISTEMPKGKKGKSK